MLEEARYAYTLLGKVIAMRPVRRRVRAFVGGFVERRKLRGRTTEAIFRDYYLDNRWGSGESCSGPGSTLAVTKGIRDAIPHLLEELGITSMLDVPCGDFHWMRTIPLKGVDYTGGDIVSYLVEENRRYERPGVRFKCIDLTCDSLPQVDLVFVRDCLVHLSDEDIHRALRNIVASGSTYLLTTTFPAKRKNLDILTGQWRPLNLEEPPFNFPPPLEIIEEGLNSKGYTDKSLGLWRVADIGEILDRQGRSAKAGVLTESA